MIFILKNSDFCILNAKYKVFFINVRHFIFKKLCKNISKSCNLKSNYNLWFLIKGAIRASFWLFDFYYLSPFNYFYVLCSQCSYPFVVGCIKGVVHEGMPVYKNPFERGNLYIKFSITFPDNHFADVTQIKVGRSSLSTCNWLFQSLKLLQKCIPVKIPYLFQ